jgi:hypothetical protein
MAAMTQISLLVGPITVGFSHKPVMGRWPLSLPVFRKLAAVKVNYVIVTTGGIMGSPVYQVDPHTSMGPTTNVTWSYKFATIYRIIF